MSKQRIDPQKTQAIKNALIASLGLGDDAGVMVTELACGDSDCPDVETVFAVLQAGHARIQVKLDIAINEISDDQVREVCSALREMREANPAALG